MYDDDYRGGFYVQTRASHKDGTVLDFVARASDGALVKGWQGVDAATLTDLLKKGFTLAPLGSHAEEKAEVEA